MKISLYTISLSGGYYRGPAVPLMDIFPKAKAWGYDGIELEGKRPHGSPLDLDAPARDAIKKAACDNGLELSAVAAYNDFSSPIEEHRENELLMVRELIRLARDIGAPIVRVFAFWSGVTRREGLITYDVARYDTEHRFPGTLALEQWGYIRACLKEAARMAEGEGIVLALQNHEPIIHSYQEMLQFIREVDSPALKACLDSPLEKLHTEEHYREALRQTGSLMVHTHYGGRFVRKRDGEVVRWGNYAADDHVFLKLAKECAGFRGHIGYELCSPVVTGHDHEGLNYALEQCALAAIYMKGVVKAVG
jgi:sugar phosphate isomerase/epimerase